MANRKSSASKSAIVIDKAKPIAIVSSSVLIRATDSALIADFAASANTIQANMYAAARLGETVMVDEVRRSCAERKGAGAIVTYKVSLETSDKYRIMRIDLTGAIIRVTWLHGVPVNEDAEVIRNLVADVRKGIADSKNLILDDGIDFNPSLEAAIVNSLAAMFGKFNAGVVAALAIDESAIAKVVSGAKPTKEESARRDAIEEAASAATCLDELFSLLLPSEKRRKGAKNQNENLNVLLGLRDAVNNIAGSLDELRNEV